MRNRPPKKCKKEKIEIRDKAQEEVIINNKFKGFICIYE